jgi:hypothetical protein
MKQTAFWRGKNREYIPCLKYSVPIFVEEICKMQRLQVSGAVRPLQWSLGVKRLRTGTIYKSENVRLPLRLSNSIWRRVWAWRYSTTRHILKTGTKWNLANQKRVAVGIFHLFPRWMPSCAGRCTLRDEKERACPKHMYWLVGRRSALSTHNKLVIYKQILKPVWTCGIQLCGCTKPSNITLIQRFQNTYSGT